MAENAKFTNNAGGKVVLVSTATATGRMAAVPTSATYTGNISQQRFYANGLRWALVAPTFNTNLAAYQNKGMLMSGIIGGTAPAQAGDPFKRASVYFYDPTMPDGPTAKSGYYVPTSTSDEVNRGSSFRTWMRPTWLNAARELTGTYTPGDVTVNLKFAATNGWNLVGNPHPSQIDWNTVTKSGLVSNTYYVFDSRIGTSDNYGSYSTAGVSVP
jgi:hypothetical protein